MSDLMVEIKNLSFSHNQNKIFSNLNLNFQRHKITAILGPSGSGKTTLLRLIGGLLKPLRGRVVVNNVNLNSLSTKNLYKMRQKMGLLFQNSALFTHLNVFENVAFPLREHVNLTESMLSNIVLMKLEAVGLRGASHLYPRELSGGMTRRVALARALALDPELMMYDEPFTGQDPIALGVILRLIKNLNTLINMTSIIVSHDVKETCAIADYVYLIAEGKIISHGEPHALLNSNDEYVKQFMQGNADGVVPFHYPSPPFTQELMNV